MVIVRICLDFCINEGISNVLLSCLMLAFDSGYVSCPGSIYLLNSFSASMEIVIWFFSLNLLIFIQCRQMYRSFQFLLCSIHQSLPLCVSFDFCAQAGLTETEIDQFCIHLRCCLVLFILSLFCIYLSTSQNLLWSQI